ncbi:MAG: hypothetical protein WCT14_15010 [Treponemataceae bacterium]
MEPLAPDRGGARSETRLSIESKEGDKNAGIAKIGGTGVSFIARVVASEGAGKWLLAAEDRAFSHGPSRFSAQGPASLHVGDLVRVSADRGANGKISHQILDAFVRSRVDAIRSLGIVPDSAALVLVAAARVFGLHIEGQRISRLQAVVERAVKKGYVDETTAAIIATAADDKGIDLSSDAIAGIANASDPRSGLKDASDRRRGRSRSDRFNAEAVREAVADFQETDSPLAFMNATTGRSGKHWLVFPLDFSRGAVELKASLRVLLNSSTQELKGRVEYCAFDISAPTRYWSFEIVGSIGNGTATVRTDPPLDGKVDRLRSALTDALRPLGVDVVFPEGPPQRRLLDLAALDPPSVMEEA